MLEDAYLYNIPANADVSDDEMMVANGMGMDAYDDGKSIHDNPYKNRHLRETWCQGWRSREAHREV